MEQVRHFLFVILDFLREGFEHVNKVEGLVIALVAAIIAPAWDRIWAVALGATLVHLIADVLIPVIANHASFRLPPLLAFDFWRTAVSLYVGYLIIIAVLMVIKRMFLSPPAPAHH
ncbi:MAG TPA: hypothetical protein VG387_14075 [Rhizomicrobium sp.]|jgi:hypothetical protein|nr:hypothetical protein [Rhizomicrobium sp.]